MKKLKHFRVVFSLVLTFCLLSPFAVLAAGDGKKHFRQGIKYENAEQWDKAVEEFALAVSENPRNSEFRLHYQRAIFNASQMFMKRGAKLAEEKDYSGAFNAFRRAYAYDPVNELAKSEMERMVRLQEAAGSGEPNSDQRENSPLKVVPSAYSSTQQDVFSPRLEKHRDVPFPSGVDLFFLVKELARDLDLNVLFDNELLRSERKIKIELKNVTAAKALDYVFLQEGLFFQKVGPRTILVAAQARRPFFQQLVLRTFYLSNANPEDIQRILPQAIPAQSGRTPTTVMIDKSTNSITVRDTEENIRIIGNLIKAWDKDRAEVVMDVQIYEVSKNDLLQFGNQIGSSSELTQFGGTTRGVVGVGGNDRYSSLVRTATSAIPTVFGAGIILPAANLQALQSKGNTRLLASTQVHAFNGEKSTAKIGQRVPIKSATYVNTGNINNNGAIADVINYEQTGLTLSFEPLVFPNQDVQVKMEITSRDIAGTGINDNPIFGEREIKGSARIQNNRTLLLASVAQSTESKSKTGLPLLGLIPVLGRLFTAPKNENRQVDIVIAVTPRVLRAPSILPEDEIERPTGSLATPTNNSLEAMVIQEDKEELLAAARRLPTTAWVQLPATEETSEPKYVPTSTKSVSVSSSVKQPAYEDDPPSKIEKAIARNITPEIPLTEKAVKTLRINVPNETPLEETGNSVAVVKQDANSGSRDQEITSSLPVESSISPQPEIPEAQIKLLTALPTLKRRATFQVPILISTATPFRSAVVGLKFDAEKLAVRKVLRGEIFGKELSQSAVAPFLNAGGKMFVSLSSESDVAVSSSGIIAYVEFEALTDGIPEIAIDAEIVNVLTVDGKNFRVKF